VRSLRSVLALATFGLVLVTLVGFAISFELLSRANDGEIEELRQNDRRDVDADELFNALVDEEVGMRGYLVGGARSCSSRTSAASPRSGRSARGCAPRGRSARRRHGLAARRQDQLRPDPRRPRGARGTARRVQSGRPRRQRAPAAGGPVRYGGEEFVVILVDARRRCRALSCKGRRS
jgi:hypothetical protein